MVFEMVIVLLVFAVGYGIMVWKMVMAFVGYVDGSTGFYSRLWFFVMVEVLKKGYGVFWFDSRF